MNNFSQISPTQSNAYDIHVQATAGGLNEKAFQSQDNLVNSQTKTNHKTDVNATLKPDQVTLSNASKSESTNIQELDENEQRQVQELKERDREVRVHEQAHAAVGGQYASAPSYEYETGPDGKKYAVAGEVSIDVSEEEKPEDTIQKMQIVRAAALAPAEPSAQDLKVAAQASQKESRARADVSQNRLEPQADGDKERPLQHTIEANKKQLASIYDFPTSHTSIININA